MGFYDSLLHGLGRNQEIVDRSPDCAGSVLEGSLCNELVEADYEILWDSRGDNPIIFRTSDHWTDVYISSYFNVHIRLLTDKCRRYCLPYRLPSMSVFVHFT